MVVTGVTLVYRAKGCARGKTTSFTNHLEYNVVCIFVFIFYGKNELLALTIVNKHSLFSMPLEREISLSNNATLRQSELIRMFFISYDKRERCFCSMRM